MTSSRSFFRPEVRILPTRDPWWQPRPRPRWHRRTSIYFGSAKRGRARATDTDCGSRMLERRRKSGWDTDRRKGKNCWRHANKVSKAASHSCVAAGSRLVCWRLPPRECWGSKPAGGRWRRPRRWTGRWRRGGALAPCYYHLKGNFKLLIFSWNWLGIIFDLIALSTNSNILYSALQMTASYISQPGDDQQ